MTTVIGGKLMEVDKSALKNVIKHTDTHNRIKETDEMWRQHEKEKDEPFDDFREERSRNIAKKLYKKTLYSDRSEDGKPPKTGFWTQKLMEFEEKDPERWGHTGFKELYPEDFGIKNSKEKNEKGLSNEDSDDEEDDKRNEQQPRSRVFRPSRSNDDGAMEQRQRRILRHREDTRREAVRRQDVRRQDARRKDIERDQHEKPHRRARSRSRGRQRSQSRDEEKSKSRLPGRFNRERSRSRENKRRRDDYVKGDLRDETVNRSQEGASKADRLSRKSESPIKNKEQNLECAKTERYKEKAKEERENLNSKRDDSPDIDVRKPKKNDLDMGENHKDENNVDKTNNENTGPLVDAFGRDISRRGYFKSKPACEKKDDIERSIVNDGSQMEADEATRNENNLNLDGSNDAFNTVKDGKNHGQSLETSDDLLDYEEIQKLEAKDDLEIQCDKSENLRLNDDVSEQREKMEDSVVDNGLQDVVDGERRSEQRKSKHRKKEKRHKNKYDQKKKKKKKRKDSDGDSIDNELSTKDRESKTKGPSNDFNAINQFIFDEEQVENLGEERGSMMPVEEQLQPGRDDANFGGMNDDDDEDTSKVNINVKEVVSLPEKIFDEEAEIRERIRSKIMQRKRELQESQNKNQLDFSEEDMEVRKRYVTTERSPSKDSTHGKNKQYRDDVRDVMESRDNGRRKDSSPSSDDEFEKISHSKDPIKDRSSVSRRDKLTSRRDNDRPRKAASRDDISLERKSKKLARLKGRKRSTSLGYSSGSSSRERVGSKGRRDKKKVDIDDKGRRKDSLVDKHRGREKARKRRRSATSGSDSSESEFSSSSEDEKSRMKRKQKQKIDKSSKIVDKVGKKDRRVGKRDFDDDVAGLESSSDEDELRRNYSKVGKRDKVNEGGDSRKKEGKYDTSFDTGFDNVENSEEKNKKTFGRISDESSDDSFDDDMKRSRMKEIRRKESTSRGRKYKKEDSAGDSSDDSDGEERRKHREKRSLKKSKKRSKEKYNDESDDFKKKRYKKHKKNKEKDKRKDKMRKRISIEKIRSLERKKIGEANAHSSSEDSDANGIIKYQKQEVRPKADKKKPAELSAGNQVDKETSNVRCGRSKINVDDNDPKDADNSRGIKSISEFEVHRKSKIERDVESSSSEFSLYGDIDVTAVKTEEKMVKKQGIDETEKRSSKRRRRCTRDSVDLSIRTRENDTRENLKRRSSDRRKEFSSNDEEKVERNMKSISDGRMFKGDRKFSSARKRQYSIDRKGEDTSEGERKEQRKHNRSRADGSDVGKKHRRSNRHKSESLEKETNEKNQFRPSRAGSSEIDVKERRRSKHERSESLESDAKQHRKNRSDRAVRSERKTKERLRHHCNRSESSESSHSRSASSEKERLVMPHPVRSESKTKEHDKIRRKKSDSLEHESKERRKSYRKRSESPKSDEKGRRSNRPTPSNKNRKYRERSSSVELNRSNRGKDSRKRKRRRKYSTSDSSWSSDSDDKKSYKKEKKSKKNSKRRNSLKKKAYKDSDSSDSR